MKRRAFFLLAVAVSVGVPAGPAVAQGGRAEMEPLAVENFQPVLTFDNQGPAPKEGRLMVQVSGPVTEAVLAKLAQYGTIHGVIERYHIVVITPRGPKARRTIESLPFVSFVEEDQPRWLTGVGSWDRDILDVVDVEETGDIGAPDPREVAETGAGVHVAVIDTGLIKRWRDFLHTSQVRTDLARAFMGGGVTADLGFEEFNTSNPTNLWERDTNSHGTAVASHIIGFKIGPHVVEGVAPDAQVIPLKVFPNGSAFTFASRIIAAIAYTTELKEDNVIGPTAMNISIAGGSPSVLERAAIQDAIAEGIVVVASAGNLGEDGMGWPGAFPEVISVGATGWVEQFLPTVQPAPDTTFWRTRDVSNDPDGSGKSEELQSFVATFSSRAIPELGPMRGTDPQELDVLAPGLWTVAPCLLPGAGGGNATFCFWAGTSFSSPLTAGVAALLLEKDSTLTPSAVETALKSTALAMAVEDGRAVPVPIGTPNPTEWDMTCMDTLVCDPVGSGLLQADAALASIP